MFSYAARRWSPVEIDYLKKNRDCSSLETLSRDLDRGRATIVRKLNELDGKPIAGKKNKKSFIGTRQDLGMSFRSSWDANLARMLNFEKVKWIYEPQAFHFTQIKSGVTSYLPDFYVADWDIYIEVKGQLIQRAKTAIRRFRKFFPEEFKKLQMIPGNPKTKAAQFAVQMGVPIYAYYKDLVKKYKDTVSCWE